MTLVQEASEVRPPRALHCSFCGKSQADVALLVSGPGVTICDECEAIAHDIVAQHRGKPIDAPKSFPDAWPTEQLLGTLALHEQAFERLGRAMQDVVDILREREISWAQIGETLGVSRQAAWKRFA